MIFEEISEGLSSMGYVIPDAIFSINGNTAKSSISNITYENKDFKYGIDFLKIKKQNDFEVHLNSHTHLNTQSHLNTHSRSFKITDQMHQTV